MPNAYIKKLKQKSTGDIIYPESKTGAIYMSDNVTTLDGYLGSTDFSKSGKSTISGIIGETDISEMADGTITGALNNIGYKYVHLRNTENSINWYLKKYFNGRLEGYCIWTLGQYTFYLNPTGAPSGNLWKQGGTISINLPYDFSILNGDEEDKNIELATGKINCSYLGNNQSSPNIFLSQTRNSNGTDFSLIKYPVNTSQVLQGEIYILMEILDGTWLEKN